MSDTLRMTGLYSGMDTESIIQSLVSTKSEKVTKLQNEQKKLGWKQTVWQDLNSQIYSLYSKTLSNMRFSSAYSKKTTKVSDSTKASIVASDSAINGTQTLEINKTAKAGYLTGASLATRIEKTKVNNNYNNTTKLSTIDSSLVGKTIKITVGDGSAQNSTQTLNITSDTKVQDVIDKIKATGLDAKFENNQFVITSTDPATQVTFSEEGSKSDGALKSLGLERNASYENGSKADMGIVGKIEGSEINVSGSTPTNQSKLSDIAPSLVGKTISLGFLDGTTKNITIENDMTIEAFVSKLNEQGVNAEFDESNHKFIISAKSTDGTNQFTFTDDDAGTAIGALGLSNPSASTYYEFTGADIGTKIVETTVKQSFTTSNKLTDIAPTLTGSKFTVTVGKGDDAKTTSIDVTSDMTIAQFVNKLKEAGVNASFDENNQRFFISSTATGEANEFSIKSSLTSGLKALGLDADATYDNGSEATRITAEDAEIVLNGATFQSSSNTFSINGLTITASDVTDGAVLTITTETDYDGIYDSIKDFLSEYNEIINKMYKLYNADSARKYDMLTDDEKESMTDDEIEAWEDKIKDALLRKDSTLYSVMNTMRSATTTYYEVNGEKLYLSDFGIGTLSYFVADEDERYALHIDGDSDDENTASNTDKLKARLASDPEGTAEFFASLCKNMYDLLYKAMGSTDYSSIYKVYDDKRLQEEYDDYDDKISDAEDELSDYEDRWYDKFGSMETALSKLQSTQNTISSLLGS